MIKEKRGVSIINPNLEANIFTAKTDAYLLDIFIVLSFAFAFTAFPIGGVFFGMLALRRINRDDFTSSALLTAGLVISGIRAVWELFLTLSALIWISAFLLAS